DVPTAHRSRARECCPDGEGVFDGHEQLLVKSSTTGIFSLARTLAKQSTARRSCSSLFGRPRRASYGECIQPRRRPRAAAVGVLMGKDQTSGSPEVLFGVPPL